MRILIILLVSSLLFWCRESFAQDPIMSQMTKRIAQQCMGALVGAPVREKLSEVVLAVARDHLDELRHPGDKMIIRLSRSLEDPSMREITSEGRAFLERMMTEHVDFLKILTEIDANKSVSVGRYIKTPSARETEFAEAVRKANWKEIVRIYDTVLTPEERTPVKVQQKMALALTKRGIGNDRGRALAILNNLLVTAGPDGETLGLKAAVYKALYTLAENSAQKMFLLGKSIENYRQGLRKDIGNFYPGIALIGQLLERIGRLQGERYSRPQAEIEITDDLKEIARQVPVIREYVMISLETSAEVLKKAKTEEDKNKETENQYWAQLTLMQLEILAGDLDNAKVAYKIAKSFNRPVGWGISTYASLKVYRDRIPGFAVHANSAYYNFMEDFRIYHGIKEEDR
jgi:hypothetical protein